MIFKFLFLTFFLWLQGAPSLSVEEFSSKMSEQNTIILDVRTPEEWEKGVIGKPLYIDYFSKDFSNKLKSLDKSATYLVYCASGYRSDEAVTLMKKHGIESAFSLKGGIVQWQRKKMPLSPYKP